MLQRCCQLLALVVLRVVGPATQETLCDIREEVACVQASDSCHTVLNAVLEGMTLSGFLFGW